MNFTSDIKKEIILHGIEGEKALKASFSAYLRTSGVIGEMEGKTTFFIVSETESVAEFFISVFDKLYNKSLVVSFANTDKMSGRDKLVIQPSDLDAEMVLEDLNLYRNGEFLKISDYNFETEEEIIAYIQGVFLSSGSCTLPSSVGKSGYHLEFVFSRNGEAEDFCDLLLQEEIIAKAITRSQNYVAYVKNKETISDILSILSTTNALNKFTHIVEERDEANMNNRANNCFSGNADKQALASVKLKMSIDKIKEKTDFVGLDVELVKTAKMRLENPTLTLKELAELMGISKSCLNHRLRKLTKIAEEL